MATVSSVTSTSTAGTTQAPSGANSMSTQDFMNLMLTQLQNQDPMNPTSNSDLMAQMSQIGQLQANSQLQTLLTGMTTQNQLSTAGSLLGKMVQGLDANSNQVQGLVTSIQVTNNQVLLNLDSGSTLALDKVTNIAPGPNAQSTATGTAVAP
ncbi:MAG: flagellar hook capping FlgD N-terminal domain-containing protein [Tepidisphaerales bacterium]